METFEFTYVAQKTSFSIDGDKLIYKIALKKGSVELSKIKYFRKFDYNDYDQFIIIYKDKEGKAKTLKSYAEKESEGLNPLILRLGEILPDKDLSNTDAKEARKLMKVGNAVVGGFIGAVIIMVAVLALIFRGSIGDIANNLPMLIILAIVVVILVFAFTVVYYRSKRESKDW